MKKILRLLVLFLLPVALKAQTTTITTYYVIPPTNGCNGVWAVDNPTWAICGNGAIYNINPPGCTTMTGPVSGDTLFLALCAFPCDVVFSTMSGGACICGTGTATGIDNLQLANPITTTYPNPTISSEGWNILFHQPGNKFEIKIFNSFGQLLQEEQGENASEIYHLETSSLSTGTYVAEILVNGNVSYHERLTIVK